MGLYAGFDVINDFGFIDATEEWGIIPDYSEGCAVFVETFLSVANNLVPVDTGYLKSTLSARTDGDTFCEVFTYCEYAQYPEYGTWCQRAQPYFTPALEEALNAAAPLWYQAEEDALMEDQLLTEEEEMEEQAEALAIQQSTSNGMAQAASSRASGGMGGINFSSPGAFIGSIIASFIAAVIITTVQAMMGKDFSSKTDRIKTAGTGGEGSVYMPDIEII